ncbi:efflux RND transporter periplasmic adaptor subunit [Roseateles koreensis]|uniref:Efflux RND transporter periplasmic adaptor subunit n=1 Tax=Roseateles koreensis TaxID=2987526 RepID=A0ABT5KQZ6_9BURK|nr:efflux RND transporter periplasmic adaptor subunit [Roseateles koreensis]MDC8785336.1 efflux RND transporter periplasmic adaptor subunit [Roseateles koreensis]
MKPIITPPPSSGIGQRLSHKWGFPPVERRTHRTHSMRHIARTGGLALGLALLGGLALLMLNPHGKASAMAAPPQTQTGSPALASYLVTSGAQASRRSFDGVVEAQRQTVLAAQVAGAIEQLNVKVGDRVEAGQVLLRIDARSAADAALASEAQAQAARANLQLATRDFERQQQLFQKHYISQAALDQAESQFKATQAQVHAQLAQLGGARTLSSLHVVRSPYSGVVAEVPVNLGDMALPGRPLLTLYDPRNLRVSASLPQQVVAAWKPGAAPQFSVMLPGREESVAAGVAPTRVQVLPTVDAGTHTVALRLDLPQAGPNTLSAAPGMFARVWLLEAPDSPGAIDASGALKPPSDARIMVPRSAVLRRTELTAAYVLSDSGRPELRQLRLGAVQGDRVEVLAGLSPGERIASQPAEAARQARP